VIKSVGDSFSKEPKRRQREVYYARGCVSRKLSPLHGVALFSVYATISPMDTRKAGRLGAIATNKILTPEIRSKAARKGWRNRKKQLKAFISN